MEKTLVTITYTFVPTLAKLNIPITLYFPQKRYFDKTKTPENFPERSDQTSVMDTYRIIC